MKFTRILRELLRFWPSEINVSDGELREGGGGYFPTLSKTWDSAEKNCESWSEWHQIMTWAIFCGLHQSAVRAKKEGRAEATKREVDLPYIESKFSESLYAKNPSYPRWMRKAYCNNSYNAIQT